MYCWVACLHKTLLFLFHPWGWKIHNLVGSSSQEEKSVQGLGSFLQAALFIYKGETKSCIAQQESSHRRGFLCSQLPQLFWPSPPPKIPLSLGSSQGHTLCLLRRLPLSGPAPTPCFFSWAAWLHNHIHLFPKQLHAKVPLPRASMFLRKTNEPLVWLETSVQCGGFEIAILLLPPFPSRLRGLFKGKIQKWRLIRGLPY